MEEILGLIVLLLFGAYMAGGWPYVAVAFALVLLMAVLLVILYRDSRS
jgi:hypothetical protein